MSIPWSSLTSVVSSLLRQDKHEVTRGRSTTPRIAIPLPRADRPGNSSRKAHEARNPKERAQNQMYAERADRLQQAAALGKGEATDFIKREDKLSSFTFSPSTLAQRDSNIGLPAEGHLLSPYAEEGPTDDEGLYQSLCSVRKAYEDTRKACDAATHYESLFLGDDVLEFEGGEGFAYGIRTMMELFDSHL